MATETYYRQCTLRQAAGATQQVVWIPEALAQIGKTVVLSDEGTAWTVQTASTMRVSESYLLEHERDYLKQREASDV